MSINYNFELGVESNKKGYIYEIFTNLRATTTIISETVLTFCKFTLIFKLKLH
jgi:hypothetical protein